MRSFLFIFFYLTSLTSVSATGTILNTDDIATDYMSPSAALPAISTFPTELTVDGLISLARGNYSIQMGAFLRRSNAEYLHNKLEKMLGLQVEVVNEDGLFKLFINNEIRNQAPCLYIPVSLPELAVKHRPAPSAVATATVEQVPDKMQEPPSGTVDEAGQDTTAMNETAVTPSRPDSTVYKRSFMESLENVFRLKGSNPWLTRYNYFGKSVTLVNALIITIVISVATMIILLVVILLNRTRMEREARIRQYLLEKYQALIIDYLFGNTEAGAFRPIASDFYRRGVLVEQMIDVSVNLKGDSGEKLTSLYKELELDRDSVRRARSRKWHVKIKGFRELAFMNITEANDEMFRALNSRNEILRMEAQIALVRLGGLEPFEFLSHLKRPFSLWEQIMLHDLIIHHDITVPDFSRWLSSENPTVVMFALRMIREFRQNDTEQEVRKVLLHRNPEVSRLAIEVAGDLGMKTTLDTLKRMYKFQEYNNCLEIVKTMGKMPEMAMMGFLKLVLDKEDDVQLQIEAVKAIENMGEEGVKTLVKIMKSEYKNYNIIVRHVLDRRIY